MEREEILNFLYQNKDIFVKQVLKQRWKRDKYSYLLTPRQDHGLMLLLLGKITFVFDDKKLIVNEGDVIFLPKNSFYEAIFGNEAGASRMHPDVPSRRFLRNVLRRC